MKSYKRPLAILLAFIVWTVIVILFIPRPSPEIQKAHKGDLARAALDFCHPSTGVEIPSCKMIFVDLPSAQACQEFIRPYSVFKSGVIASCVAIE